MNSQQVRRVLRAQSGDKDALNELFRSLQLPLHRYIRTLVAQPTVAEDVLQDVFLLIYRKLGWLREPSLLRPWAFRIASREAFRRLAKQRRIRDVETATDQLDYVPDQVVELDPAMRRALTQALEQLSPASRAVLSLHFDEGLTLVEVAEVLELRLGTVKSRLNYGLEAMRRHLEIARKGAAKTRSQ